MEREAPVREEDQQRNVRPRTEGAEGLLGLDSASQILPRPPVLSGNDPTAIFPPDVQYQLIKLRANFFPVMINQEKTFYQYSVAIRDLSDNHEIGGNKAQQIFELVRSARLREYANNIAYDGGKTFYSPIHLFDTQIFDDITFKRKQYAVELRLVAAHRTGECTPQQVTDMRGSASKALQVFDVALRECMRRSPQLVAVGRTYFRTTRRAASSEGGADLLRGWHQSIRPIHFQGGRFGLNVDLAVGFFISPTNLLRFIEDSCGRGARNLEDIFFNNMHRVKAILKGIEVETTHRQPRPGKPGRRLKVSDIDNERADRRMIDMGERQISVADYFAERYTRLRHPELPCAIVKAGGKYKGQTNFIPLECLALCHGQRYTKELRGRQSQAMIREMNIRAGKRFEQISEELQDAFNDFHHTGDFLDSFGISMPADASRCALEVNAVRLAPPMLQFRGGVEQAADGSWDMRGKQFFESCSPIDRPWAIVSFLDRLDHSVVGAVSQGLNEQFDHTGIQIDGRVREPVIYDAMRHHSAEEALSGAVAECVQKFGAEPRFIVCIKPDDSAGLYGDIKRWGDVRSGIITQCIVVKGKRWNAQYWANVCVKLNAKLGGTNNTLAPKPLGMLFGGPTMVVGVSISHPPPNSKSDNSISVMVGSWDASLTKYTSTVRQQHARLQLVEHAEDMIQELIQGFKNATGHEPKNIIIYRAGISESQIPRVLEQEIRVMVEASQRVLSERPTITCLMATKAHHVRFAAMDASGEIQPGTLVFRDATHPSAFDFYLFPHKGLQGTPRPTYYRVILNEMNLAPHQVFKLTHDLSYLYFKATKSVSIVPPVYYADIIGNRARNYFAHESLEEYQQRPYNPVHSNVQQLSFFC